MEQPCRGADVDGVRPRHGVFAGDQSARMVIVERPARGWVLPAEFGSAPENLVTLGYRIRIGRPENAEKRRLVQSDEVVAVSRCGRGGGGGWIRTIEGISQQIYSLPRLATSVPHHGRDTDGRDEKS